jgi:mono/diheme cytochrome c family protein
MKRASFALACVPLVSAGLFYLRAAEQKAPAAPHGATPQAFVSRYCAACHNSKVKSGNLILDPAAALNPAEHPEVWEKVVRKLRGRYMPPAGGQRPDENTYNAAITAFETALDTEAQARPNPGRTDTFRRLNRTEYRNAIRDLLALDIDTATLLPSDDVSHGFDNVTVGELSPTLLERYLTAAQKIARLAIGRPGRSLGGDTFNVPPDLTQEQHLEDLPLGTRGGMAVKYTFPVNAEYEFVIRLARDRNEHVEGLREPHEVELMLDGERVRLFTVEPPPRGSDHEHVDKHLDVRIPVKSGPHVVAVAFPKKPFLLPETERQPYVAFFNMDRHPRVQPAVYSVSVNGPYDPKDAGETPSRKRILVCNPTGAADEEACAKRIFANLARRAYRRPVTDADLRAPLRFFSDAKAERGFEGGIEMGLRAILVSPEFLFRIEQDPAGLPPRTAYRISDTELASRLSFFLWNSIPDDELLDLGVRGELSKPAVLDRQVRRMLADKRAESIVSNFVPQWLYLRNLASATPDMRLFPDFDDNLRQSFRRETELLFESIMREDRGILDLLTANYSYLNERLAKHYGIPNIYGSRFRRVTFDKDSARGGLLRQGSILTVTSYATRTSPVIRGKWVLDNIIGMPPPPPPASVPALKENTASTKKLSMRERIAQHRADPACAGCHTLMDPVGFAFENYDAVGRWRIADDSGPIDASGVLPDGSRFKGVAELQQAVLKYPDVFATTFTEKLLTYALGRGVEMSDASAVRSIVRQARSNRYRFSSFISGIVNSTPFQMRRTQ